MVTVRFLGRQELAPYFGMAVGRIDRKKCYALVRDDLSPRVKRFVIKHEIYHLRDKSNFLGEFGREFRANFFPGIRDPLGLLATICATAFNKERRALYYRRFRGI